MSREPAILVEGVSKRFRLYHERHQSLKASLLHRKRATYENFDALKDVSLEVEQGETLGLVGENGSGKSTLLKCMTRILRPDSGRVEVRGKASALLELGAGFHPELSGRENIYLNGSILGLRKKELDARFDDIVGFAGLERFIDTAVKNYSSGMYVRLGFSVAINVEPDVLLVDEVLAVGDEAFQRRCTDKFAELRSAGKTIVLVTHSMTAARNVCDRAALLHAGELVNVGSAGSVVDAYMARVGATRQDEDGEIRWGSGEARIASYDLLDGAGKPTRQVRTGDAVTLELHYDAPTPIDKPVFAFGIFTLEGVHLMGPNTRDADEVPDRIEGCGSVTFEVERLLLVPGSYILSVSLGEYSGLHTYDVRHRLITFDVLMGAPRETVGFASLPGRWHVGGRAGG